VMMDKMSMAASVEARVPLLDRPLVEWAMRLSAEHKIRGLEGKVLLKRLARKLLPAEVVDRPKVGFTVPLSPWFRGELRELLADTLLSPRCLGRGWYDAAVLRATVDDHLSGRRDRARELWTLLTLELWPRAWIDGDGARPEAWSLPPRVAAGAAGPKSAPRTPASTTRGRGPRGRATPPAPRPASTPSRLRSLMYGAPPAPSTRPPPP